MICSQLPADKALVSKFKEEFEGYTCRCVCDIGCEESKCKCTCDCTDILKLVAKKPKLMTTPAARASGAKCGALRDELDGHINNKTKPPWGLKQKYKDTVAKEPFKYDSVFHKFFTDWDMISRIACDPAHQFYNLVKDYLALIGDCDKFKFTQKYLDREKKHGRFAGVTLQSVPFHVSQKFKVVLTELLATLKVPDGRPDMKDFFTDEYEKIKLAEALAFCGDVGVYLTDQTDIQSDVKEVFIELLQVTGCFVHKVNTDSALKKLQKQLVCNFLCVIIYVLPRH